MSIIAEKFSSQLQQEHAGETDGDENLVEAFCRLSKEKLVRSLILFFIAVIVVFFFIVSTNLLVHFLYGLHDSGIIGEPIEKIGDLREGIDYKEYEGTDITYVEQS
ncbi:MAG: hypothetical protein GY757_25990, partial [bacterium]|nr:hypothetical protein [bacterium]